MYLWNDIALIEDDSHFTKWVKETGRLDHHQGFLQYLRPHIHGTVLDVGANIGTHTIFYARYANEVHAFEPNPIAYECLKYNLISYPNVNLYPYAIGAASGSIDLVSCGPNYGAAYTIPGSAIPVVALDALHLEHCDFIKIDVEGDELAVLQGADRLIRTCHPVMCIECNAATLERKGLSQTDLLHYIEDLNYSTNYRKPDISCDLLCLPL